VAPVLVRPGFFSLRPGKGGRRDSGGASLVSDTESRLWLDQAKLPVCDGPEETNLAETFGHHRYWKSLRDGQHVPKATGPGAVRKTDGLTTPIAQLGKCIP